MRQKVVMTGTLGVMTESNLQVMKELLERKLPGAEFQFLFDAPQDDKDADCRRQGCICDDYPVSVPQRRSL